MRRLRDQVVRTHGFEARRDRPAPLGVPAGVGG